MAHIDGTKHGLAIVVIGVSGSGKTTVGRRLAPALDATFLEGDDYHPSSNIAKMRSGVPLEDADRWPWLEKLGRAIAEHGAQGRAVVAACSALRVAYREALAEAARRPLAFVHLTIDPKTLEARMRARRQHFMPTSLLESQLAALEPLGRDEDGTEIRETGTIETTVQAIRRWVHRREAGGAPQTDGDRRHRRPFVRENQAKPRKTSGS